MKAAFFSPGMMAMHFADSSNSRGMALSGARMISRKTRAEARIREMSTLRSEDASAGKIRLEITIATKVNRFHMEIPFQYSPLDGGVDCRLALLSNSPTTPLMALRLGIWKREVGESALCR